MIKSASKNLTWMIGFKGNQPKSTEWVVSFKNSPILTLAWNLRVLGGWKLTCSLRIFNLKAATQNPLKKWQLNTKRTFLQREGLSGQMKCLRKRCSGNRRTKSWKKLEHSRRLRCSRGRFVGYASVKKTHKRILCYLLVSVLEPWGWSIWHVLESGLIQRKHRRIPKE